MATITTGTLDPILMMLLRTGFGQGRQQGYSNLQSAMQLREQVLSAKKQRDAMDFAQALQLAQIVASVAAPMVTSWGNPNAKLGDVFGAALGNLGGAGAGNIFKAPIGGGGGK